MKKLLALPLLVLTILGLAYFADNSASAAVAWEDTPAQVPTGIAVGINQIIEVSFPDMANKQGCGFNGAFVLDASADSSTKTAMLAVLLSAKEHGRPVRVRLQGCTDRPKITYVFLDPSWI